MIYDQAAALRRRVEQNHKKKKPTKVITITSGKGGVGKSNFTLNFALALKQSGLNPVVLDADLGLANIDVLMGIAPKYTLLDLLSSHLKIWDIIEKGVNDLEFIAGGSELENLFDLKQNNNPYLFEQLILLNGYADILLIDTGAGLTPESLKFILSSDEVIIVSTPEPTSITDTYAMIKMIQSKKKDLKINLIVNQITSEQEGVGTANRISLVSERFLNFKINLLGFIYKDDVVSKAVKKQIPFYISYPNSKAAKSIKVLAEKYTKNNSQNNNFDTDNVNGVKGFLDRMSYWLRK